MSKTFAKWTLRLHRPWQASPEEVKGNHGTHVEALVEYLHDEECRVPDAIWNEILRVKRNENSVVVNNSVAVTGIQELCRQVTAGPIGTWKMLLTKH